MKNWIGTSIILIGLLHISVGFVFLWPIFSDLLVEGLFNTVHTQPSREAFFWFTFFGVLLMILGAWVRWVELQKALLPNFLGWSLLGMVALMLLIMPISGAWLMLIPLGQMIKKSRKT